MREDFVSVWKIFSNAVKHMNETGIYQWDEIYPNQENIRSDIENGQLYVLTEQEIPIAAAVLNEQQEPEYDALSWRYRKGKIAVLHRLCVSPSHQNNGLGKKTVLLAEQELLRMGYSILRLDAFSENPYALKMYESLGYSRVGEVHFRKGRFYCYEKLLNKEI